MNLQDADVSRTTALHKTRILKNSAKDLGTNKKKVLGLLVLYCVKKLFTLFSILGNYFVYKTSGAGGVAVAVQ